MTTLEEHTIDIEEGHAFPHRIRRCFMTGKQCIFSSRQPMDSTAESLKERQKEPEDYDIFVAMPFRDNLDTFYEWSLKRFLTESFGIKNPEKQIRRADEFRDIGYVMCEKICRRIQDADVIVADLSIENANVMYELGLSVGLGKQLLVICNENNAKNRISNELMKSIGLTQDKVLKYTSVSYIIPKPNLHKDMLQRIRLSPCNASINIVSLVFSKSPDGVSYPSSSQNRPLSEMDIHVEFRDALRAAVGVAISDIDKMKSKPNDLDKAWTILNDEDKLDDLKVLKPDNEVELIRQDNNPESFAKVSEKVDTAFICLIDLAGENSHSYFWLGYCHARGINAIPIYRSLQNDPSSSEPDEKHKGQHAIAFDIRALWYIQYERKDIKRLATSLRSAFEELIAKDIPRMQRNVFWERLTRHPTVHIYTGAVHHKLLNREVVGDWDQRTVSELVRYLSSAEESVVPELERPIYSPTTIKKKLDKDWKGFESIKDYIKLVEHELKDKNCLIVASADVNPLTEIILANAYELQHLQFSDQEVLKLEHDPKHKVVVALKGWEEDETDPPEGETVTPDDKTGNPEDETVKSDDDGDIEPISTFFSRDGKAEKITSNRRGFFVEGHVIERLYKSQDQVDNQKFTLLAHLLVMKNPFSEKQDTLIVLLNGVSGPATFALAEVLTGGKSIEKSTECEKLLTEFNRVWDNNEKDEKLKNKLFGVEGFIEVEIQPKQSPKDLSDGSDTGEKNSPKNGDDKSFEAERQSAQHKRNVKEGSDAEKKINRITVDDKFYDKREILRWFLLSDKKELSSNNPRPFSFNPVTSNTKSVKTSKG